MRFVSKIRKYSICYQRDVVEHYATGESRILKPLLNCEFDNYGSILPWEMEAARSQFINTGTNLEMDTVTTVDPAYRFSVFDTEIFQRQHGISDEKREGMERFLLNEEPSRPNFAYGTYYLHADAPVLAPPWPSYDSFRGVRGTPTAQRIAERVEEDGYNLDDVIAYEKAHLSRQDVLDALEALRVVEPVEVTEFVSA